MPEPNSPLGRRRRPPGCGAMAGYRLARCLSGCSLRSCLDLLVCSVERYAAYPGSRATSDVASSDRVLAGVAVGVEGELAPHGSTSVGMLCSGAVAGVEWARSAFTTSTSLPRILRLSLRRWAISASDSG